MRSYRLARLVRLCYLANDALLAFVVFNILLVP